MTRDDDGGAAGVASISKAPELRLPPRVDPAVAEELVERARADGVDLVGPGGLLGQLTKQVLETGLEVEMDEHLGYEKHAAVGRDDGNSRNGTRSKKVITEVGPVDIAVPGIVTVRSNRSRSVNVSAGCRVWTRW